MHHRNLIYKSGFIVATDSIQATKVRNVNYTVKVNPRALSCYQLFQEKHFRKSFVSSSTKTNALVTSLEFTSEFTISTKIYTYIFRHACPQLINS